MQELPKPLRNATETELHNLSIVRQQKGYPLSGQTYQVFAELFAARALQDGSIQAHVSPEAFYENAERLAKEFEGSSVSEVYRVDGDLGCYSVIAMDLKEVALSAVEHGVIEPYQGDPNDLETDRFQIMVAAYDRDSHLSMLINLDSSEANALGQTLLDAAEKLDQFIDEHKAAKENADNGA
jgi:hypothetical protein